MIDIHDGASLRNLERIQEDAQHHERPTARGATAALVIMSGACVVLAALGLGARRSSTAAPRAKVDPLGELAAKPTSSTVLPGEVTFPGLLSDKSNPAAAYAATLGPLGASSLAAPPTALRAPPQPGDVLPVVPLPGRHARGGTAYRQPDKSDKLTMLAGGASEATRSSTAMEPTVSAIAGAEGGWQVQVSSFRTHAEADGLASQLRSRGHRAHIQKADIPARGTWHRVRLGPFASQAEALRYRTSFESKEKMPGFVLKSGSEQH